MSGKYTDDITGCLADLAGRTDLVCLARHLVDAFSLA